MFSMGGGCWIYELYGNIRVRSITVDNLLLDSFLILEPVSDRLCWSPLYLRHSPHWSLRRLLQV
jgi:hypothetical protein